MDPYGTCAPMRDRFILLWTWAHHKQKVTLLPPWLVISSNGKDHETSMILLFMNPDSSSQDGDTLKLLTATEPSGDFLTSRVSLTTSIQLLIPSFFSVWAFTSLDAQWDLGNGRPRGDCYPGSTVRQSVEAFSISDFGGVTRDFHEGLWHLILHGVCVGF